MVSANGNCFVTLYADFLEVDAHILNIDREHMTERSLEAGIERPNLPGLLMAVGTDIEWRDIELMIEEIAEEIGIQPGPDLGVDPFPRSERFSAGSG